MNFPWKLSNANGEGGEGGGGALIVPLNCKQQVSTQLNRRTVFSAKNCNIYFADIAVKEKGKKVKMSSKQAKKDSFLSRKRY